MLTTLSNKDIKPANILIHPDTGQIQLMTFVLPSAGNETQSLQNLILEAWPTIAEQTTYDNRALTISLTFTPWASFSELLTQTLPFGLKIP